VATNEKELPRQPLEFQDVLIWDFKTRTWIKGYRKDLVRLPEVYSFKWTNCTTTDKAPDGIDQEIELDRAKSVAIQADSTPALNTGSSIDLNVESSVDGSKWDTTPYAEMNIGDAEVKTMLVEPGPFRIRLRLDYNSGGTRADVNAIMKVRE
jgi:hypothetical protein